MKKLVSVFMTCCALFLAGCGAQQDDGKVKIGVSIASFNDTFLMYVKDAMDAKAKELGDVEIVYTDGKEDVTIQLSQVENFIAQGMDSIIVIPASTDATKPITNAALKADINLVYVNRRPDYLPEGSYYIGSEERVAGEMQARYVAEALGGKGNVGILMGPLGADNTNKRTDGVKGIVADYPDMQVTREQSGKWMRDMGLSILENWIASGDKMDAIISNNDDMALGAIAALEANGMKKDVMVVGLDATPDALAFMKDGRLDATIFQDSKGQGEASVINAYKLAKKEAVEKETMVPFKLVTPENFKDFL